MSAVLESPPFFLRPMGEDDVGIIMDIETAIYSFPWTAKIFHDCIRVGYICQVCEIENKIVGYCIMSTGANEAHILNLCIAEQHRRKGLGRHMLVHMMKMAKQRDVESLFLEVRPSNKAAIALYESLGFNEIGLRKDYYPALSGREDAVILAKNILFQP